METKKNNTRRFLVLVALAFLFFIPQDIFSQGPPPWAPAHGYRAKTRHIYFPDHNVYLICKQELISILEMGVGLFQRVFLLFMHK